MGFDIECIINIQTYPGEYFCPVCRTLVYPNEALQSLCTHLYCKPCLAHVANTTKACPYDGYLVTEADSKPLIESDKALADSIGKVKIYCQYRRSGCTWEGILSDSSAHCSGCTFGNSFVICNSCGIQIENRQVHDHAQTCSGAYQAPQAVDASQNAQSSTSTASATYMDQNHAVAISGPSTSEAHISQTSAAPLPSGQAPNQQANAISQTAAAAPSATPTLDPWYQHQQQYYQQYSGYNPYQQSYQQYYPYPQQLGQTYQQGQYNSQVYVQPQPVPQVPSQPQPSQQPQPHSQEKVTQPPVALQRTNQLQSHVQSAAPHYRQVNPQQQLSSSQQRHPQGNATFQSQPLPKQYAQVPGYQQPSQSTHPAVPQNNTQSSQPQHHLHHKPLPHSQYPPQIDQPSVSNVKPHASHLANAVVTGHQSDQPPQQISTGPLYQHAVHSHVATGSLPVHNNITQQALSMRPHMPLGLVGNQQKPAVPTQMTNNHNTQPQQLHTLAHPPASLVQHHLGVQSNQQSMPQQSQAYHASLQGQYSHFGQQQPLQSLLRPNLAHQVMKPGAHGYNLAQQSAPLVPGFVPQQPQSYGAGPTPAVGGFGTAAPNKLVPLGSSHSSENSNFSKQGSDALSQVESQRDTNVSTDSVEPIAKKSVKNIKMEEIIEETRDGPGSSRIVVNDIDKEVTKGRASELVTQETVKGEHTGDTHPAGKSLEASAMEVNIDTGIRERLEPLKQKEEFTVNQDLQTANLCAFDANSSDSLADPLKSQSFNSSGFRPRAPGFSPTSSNSQRPDHLSPQAPIGGFPGPGSTASYGRGRGIFGPSPRNFGLQLGAHQIPYGRNSSMPPHDREYLDMPPHKPRLFEERPRFFNLPPYSVGESLHENRFPGLPRDMQRIEHGGTENMSYREHIAPGYHHKHLQSRDPLEEELLSVPSWIREMSRPDKFPGPFSSGDGAGFGAFPVGGRRGEKAGGHHLRGQESFGGNFSDFQHLGKPGLRSNYLHRGFEDDRFYADTLSPFETLRKRKPVSVGWCRLCKIDCESVEGLDIHSQSKEHQRIAMVIVRTIKQQNKKNIKIPGGK